MTQAFKKKLIEVALPLEAINHAAMKEKNNPFLKGHPRSLHQWFARRPLPTCRAVLFAQLVDDPSSNPEKFDTTEKVEIERQRLFKIIEKLVVWENMTEQSVISDARKEILSSCNGEFPSAYDPFLGGGAIPFEAQRLGLKSFASDLNPIPVTIGKAMIELPQKFWNSKPVNYGSNKQLHYEGVQGLQEDIRYYGEMLKQRVLSKVKDSYPKCELPKENGGGTASVIAWVWARTVPSPDPAQNGAHTPLIASFALCKKKGKEACVIPIIDRVNCTIKYHVTMNPTAEEMEISVNGTKLGRGANFKCLFSGAAITSEYVKNISKAGGMGQVLVAVIAEGNRKRLYLTADALQAKAAEEIIREHVQDIKLPSHPQYVGVQNYGFNTFADLYTSRQLSTLVHFTNELKKIHNDIVDDAINAGLKPNAGNLRTGSNQADAYSEAIQVYLALAIDKLADYNNSLCGWSNSNENIVHLFNRHAIPMIWDFVEANPFGGMLDFSSLVKSVSLGISKCVQSSEGRVFQADAAQLHLEEKNLVVSTDPPYYDNVPYADISDFFYLWLRSSLKEIYPNTFSTLSVPKSDEIVADKVRHGSAEAAESFFLDRMKKTVATLATASSSSYPMAIYYAFKQNEMDSEGLSSTGWATFLQSILDADCSIVATWPVRTESQTRKRAVSSNALANSVVIVCRKRSITAQTVTRAEFIRKLKSELPRSIEELQAANVSPADMPQSAIGPGIRVFSQFKEVLEADDTPMTIKTALKLINEALDEFLNDLQGDFDPDTRFSVTWFEQHGFLSGDFGSADNLARARGISVESVKHAGIIESSANKVRILKRDELNPDWDPASDTHLTIWECCQYLVREYEENGEAAAAILIKKIGFERAETVKDLAYYLYDVCSNKRQDAREATSYNGLIAVWSDLTRLASTIHDTDTNRQAAMDF